MDGITIEWLSFARLILYGLVAFVPVFIWSQWLWSKKCNKFIRVLIIEEAGSTRYEYVPKNGGQLTVKNKAGKTKTWPVNALNTVNVPYPGLGFMPSWLQKSIQYTEVNEQDLEPLLNRSPHMAKVMSPDVIRDLEFILEKAKDDALKNQIQELIDETWQGPTREPTLKPEHLGAMMQSSVMEALAKISDDVMDLMKQVNQKLTRIVGPNPLVVYIGLGLCLILTGFLTYQIMSILPGLQDMSEIGAKMDVISKALGVTQ